MSTPPLPLTNNRRWAITIGVLIGMFMAALEATVVSTAMPTIVGKFGGMERYSWPTSAYLITSTVTVPVWGKLSDIYGRRLLYQCGIAVFLVGSLLCGLSHSMTQLIAFRLVQGMGAGALVPLTMTIIGDIYTLAERARMQAVFSAVWGIASIIGPYVGGVITDNFNWGWVFFINIPVGIISVIILQIAFHEAPRTTRPTVNYAGAITLMGGVTLLMMAIGAGQGPGQSSSSLQQWAGALVLLAIFARIETRAADPIIPFSLFRNRMVTVANAIAFLGGSAMFTVLVFVPLFAKGVRGATATQAGSLLTPFMLSWVFLSIVGGRMLLRIGYRPTIQAGLVILTCGFAGLATFGHATAGKVLYGDLIVIGSGMGLMMLTLLLAVQHSVERTQLGIATSLNQFSRSIGGAAGVALMGAVLAAHSQSGDPHFNAFIAGQFVPPAAQLAAMQSMLANSLHLIFWIAAALAALGLFLSFIMPRPNGAPQPAPHSGAGPAAAAH